MRTRTLKVIISAAVAFGLNTALFLPTGSARSPLPFEEGDSLEEIRYKIDYNGYYFTVDHTWVYDLPPDRKASLFNRHFPLSPRPRRGVGITDPLARHRRNVDIPSSLDWRNYRGRSYIAGVGSPVRDQGDCGACYAFSACAAGEGAYNWATGRYNDACVDFSEAFVAFCLSDEYDGFDGCDGSDYDYQELDALIKYGVCAESVYPYADREQSCPAPAWNAPRIQFSSWHRVACGDVEAIKTAIMIYGVVDAAVYAGGAFLAYSGGIYQDTNTDCYSHPCYYTPTNRAVALVGWNDNGGNGYWILRNSWGSSWGENGYMRIKYTSAYVACEVCYLIYGQPPPTPSPPPTPLPYIPGDYNGDGTADLAVFRPSTGLWAVMGLTRAYFGKSGDTPVPGDYTGDQKSDIALYRGASGLWAVKDFSRFYFRNGRDIPVSADYSGDGSFDAGIMEDGFWRIRTLSEFYFGREGDNPIAR